MEMPRPYISWSQMNLVEKSPWNYVAKYLEEQIDFENKYMRLGKRLADRMEIGLPTDDALLEHLVVFLPKGEKQEFDIEVDFEGIPMRGKLDSFSPSKKTKDVREYKTGKKWTQRIADEHGQLKFYATLVWVKYGVIPKIFLDWIPTRELEDGTIEMTGAIQTFEVKITMTDLILFRARIKKAWAKIQELTAEHYKFFEI